MGARDPLEYGVDGKDEEGASRVASRGVNIGGVMNNRTWLSIGIVIFFVAVLLFLYLTLPAAYFAETLPARGEAHISPFWLAVASWLFGVFVGCVITSLLWESDWIRWTREKPSS
jgi:hypothetical protein